ncbi:MAG: DUF6934 family protein [Bacteroidia bacterium]
MNLPNYQLQASPDLSVFKFESDAQCGSLNKLIKFTPTDAEEVVNLSFGDYDEHCGKLNDNAASGNGNPALVLATVAAAVYIFTAENPDTWVYLTGSTPARTRLYRMAISNHLIELENDFEVIGLSEKGWGYFVKGREYFGFAVKRLDIGY